MRHPRVLQIAESVLGAWCDRLQLNLTQALQIHPGQGDQLRRRDENMWGGPKGHMEYLVNVMWPFGPYWAENGATVVHPGSHHGDAGDAGPICTEMDAGEALTFLGSTLHGGGANRADAARTFSPELPRLAGYQQHRPNLGNYEGQRPSVLLEGEPDEYLGAIDELLPRQAAALRARAEKAGPFGGVAA